MLSPNLPNLDMDLARTMVAIADTGNFSRAAEQVHRSASAISLQVKKLEDMVGRELFRRDARSVSLTTDGEIFLGYARRLLKLNDEAFSRFLSICCEGSVRLGVPNDNGVVAMPEILKRFAQTHPKVEVEVRLDRTEELRRRCRAGELDLAVFSHDERRDGPDYIHCEPLVWVGARGGLAAAERPLPLALADTGCAWRGMALAALDAAEIDYRVAYSSEFCSGQLAAVAADLAIAPLPISVASGDIVRLGAEHGLPRLGDYRMTLARRDGAGAVADALADHVTASFRAIAERGTRLFA
ncbi:LysR substrate-binding domain-containing protein [Aurantimonas sp. A2-1-M11]|uniref:LysR substrate-binding domain-containing protein n=1 Tax=Aurantimonas sp. A2-1-M11 TaxID=3113712 RepID=UPI002F9251E7